MPGRSRILLHCNARKTHLVAAFLVLWSTLQWVVKWKPIQNGGLPEVSGPVRPNTSNMPKAGSDNFYFYQRGWAGRACEAGTVYRAINITVILCHWLSTLFVHPQRPVERAFSRSGLLVCQHHARIDDTLHCQLQLQILVKCNQHLMWQMTMYDRVAVICANR